MTILQKPPRSGERHAGKRWYKFGHPDEAVRHTDAWEHETFAEQQARWERSDPAYARICEEARQAKKNGEEASLRADQAKADWDARVATQRQANDDAQKAHHALKAGQTARRRTATSRTVFSLATEEPSRMERSDAARGDPRSGRFHTHTTFAIESNGAGPRDHPRAGARARSTQRADAAVPGGHWRIANVCGRPPRDQPELKPSGGALRC